MTYTLYYHPGFASLAVHMALAEMELSYSLVHINIPEGEGRERSFLAINPHGQVPALTTKPSKTGAEAIALTQVAATLEFLNDSHPGRGLMPEDPAQRARSRVWLTYLTTTLQETFRRFFHPEDFVDIAAHEADVRRTAERRLGELFDWIEIELAKGPPFMNGDAPGAPDYLFYTLARWGRYLSPAPANRPATGDLLQRLEDRPGVQKALRAEKLA